MKNIVETTSEILELVKEFELEEFELETKDAKIRLSTVKPVAMQIAQPVHAAPVPVMPAEDKCEETPVAASKSSDYTTIASPMVGTFYRRPSPEKPPYVEVGQRVEPGQSVCIIEAMKLMNEIKADVSGKIVEILAKNEEAVQEGQPLFLIEPC